MLDGLSETTLLRIAIGVAALVLFAVIVFTSRKSPGQQGKRHRAAGEPSAPLAAEESERLTALKGGDYERPTGAGAQLPIDKLPRRRGAIQAADLL